MICREADASRRQRFGVVQADFQRKEALLRQDTLSAQQDAADTQKRCEELVQASCLSPGRDSPSPDMNRPHASGVDLESLCATTVP